MRITPAVYQAGFALLPGFGIVNGRERQAVRAAPGNSSRMFEVIAKVHGSRCKLYHLPRPCVTAFRFAIAVYPASLQATCVQVK